MATSPTSLHASLKEKIEHLPPHDLYDMERFTIYRLPTFFHRELNKSLFEPCAISIGPFYKGRQNLIAMEEYKLRYLREFIARNTDSSLESCIREMQILEPEARQCYNEIIGLSSDDFVEMLLLDGCFILELSMKYSEKVHEIMCRPGFLFDPVWMDLLLFENQIPFFVIEKLFFLVITPSREYLLEVLKNLFLAQETLSPLQDLRGPIRHLLHLYHEWFVPRLDSRCASSRGERPNPCFPSRFSHRKPEEIRATKRQLMIPCVTQLREAGVKFKEKLTYKNKFDICFKNGVMEIPHIKIDTSHKPLYPNLLAFEVCLCVHYRNLTSYIVFHDLLIKTKRDVEILQRSDVVENVLANEEELAIYLNIIGKGTFIDYRDHYFVDLFADIDEYCHSRWNRHRARLVHDYFNSPWTVISVLTAFMLLGLTTVQSFFSFYPYLKL